MRAGNLNQAGTQSGNKAEGTGTIRNPYAIDISERGDVFRQFNSYQDGYLGFGGTLIVAELGQPTIAPRLGTLRFPENETAVHTAGVMHSLEHVAAVNTFGHGFDRVKGEGAAKDLFVFKFQDFALSLLGALLRLALPVGDLLAKIVDDFVLLCLLECSLVRRFLFRLVTDLLPSSSIVRVTVRSSSRFCSSSSRARFRTSSSAFCASWSFVRVSASSSCCSFNSTATASVRLHLRLLVQPGEFLDEPRLHFGIDR